MNDETPIEGLPREGDIFDGKYRIGALLGVGGMAAVIAARHLGFDEMVAIKVLLPEGSRDPAVVDRFLQEGKTAVKIRSEHVVRMIDVGLFAGRAYLVMEHLDGRDLEALLREGGPLPVVTAIDMLLQACEAIGEAHALGIIHRDLKPANLFLTHRVDGAPCVKVLDFGISKMPRAVSGASFTSSPPTLPAIVMGTPQYMSPEQMMSAAAADQRSDIWSLGAILYELLAGQIAFKGATTAEVCARVLQGAPVPLAELRSDVPHDVTGVVARCLEKDRSHRYANVAELARALAPFGSPSARVSAASILRVYEGGVEATATASNATGTMKPTAKSILARGSRPLHSHSAMSGYLAGALLTLGVAGGVAAGAVRYFGAQRAVVVAANARPPAPPATSASAPAEQASAPTHAAAAPRETSAHPRPHHPAPLASAPAPVLDDAGSGPYDAP
jgi:serine/threonine-protein kinase